MYTKASNYINQNVSEGNQIIADNNLTFNVVAVWMHTETEYPNMWKNNVGGHVLMTQGNGKKLYRMALNTNYTVKNGMIGLS